ncbi:DUF6415 family natural product biosynthesis protein [Streptomyces sp. MUM 178J]|uniref:DUF6415 family natural product biosynthesis protein n=1 Tax=Streptomyces sp. MUM 178J TaxID=2791991 RepID=UPI001F03F254|nr:DUF6415 family natural product biosynthesis protein [Streptomyces sp. MUM 178J]WRQ82800.1 DUF6415 family natural product biosynthesis protein [Streptomyces sp. MUM 178J]
MNPGANPTSLSTAGMRVDAERLLACTADVPAYDGLHELTLRLRGHVMWLVPVVSDRIAAYPRNDDALAAALGDVARAHRCLDEQLTGAGLAQAVDYARRLARTVLALTGCLARLEQGWGGDA